MTGQPSARSESDYAALVSVAWLFRVARRDVARLSQGAVARQLGISPSIISAWEQGTRVPSQRSLVAAADLFGVPRRLFVAEGCLAPQDYPPQIDAADVAILRAAAVDEFRSAAEKGRPLLTVPELIEQTPSLDTWRTRHRKQDPAQLGHADRAADDDAYVCTSRDTLTAGDGPRSIATSAPTRTHSQVTADPLMERDAALFRALLPRCWDHLIRTRPMPMSAGRWLIAAFDGRPIADIRSYEMLEALLQSLRPPVAPRLGTSAAHGLAWLEALTAARDPWEAIAVLTAVERARAACDALPAHKRAQSDFNELRYQAAVLVDLIGRPYEDERL